MSKQVIIDTDEILALVPNINRGWGINVLDLMDEFRDANGNEDGMMEYLITELNVEQNNVDSTLGMMYQVYDAEHKILLKYGLIQL